MHRHSGIKLVKQQYLLYMFLQYGELQPTNGWDRLQVCSTPAYFKGYRFLASLLQQRCSTEVNQTLHDAWPSPARYTIYKVFGGSCPLTNFASCKIHFASKSCILLFWQRYCTSLHGTVGVRQTLRRGTRNGITQLSHTGATYIRLGGHHVGHWPAF